MQSSAAPHSSPATSSQDTIVVKYAEKVLDLIMQRPCVEAIIGTRDQGKLIVSSMPEKEALDKQSNITALTEKTKVLLRRLLGEDEHLEQVRVKGTTCEIIVAYDDLLEIIAIQSHLNAK